MIARMGVMMEDGRERDGVWMGVRMEDGGSETGCGRVWTGVRMEDGGSETGCGLDGGVDGRCKGARRGVDGCGRWCGRKMAGSETGCGRVWTVVRMEDGGEGDRVWTGVDGGEEWKMEKSETGCGRVWTGGEDGRRGVDECGRG